MDLSRINNPNRLLTGYPIQCWRTKIKLFRDIVSNSLSISKWILHSFKIFSSKEKVLEVSSSRERVFYVRGRIYFCFPNQNIKGWVDWQSYLQDPWTESYPLLSVKCKHQSQFKWRQTTVQKYCVSKICSIAKIEGKIRRRKNFTLKICNTAKIVPDGWMCGVVGSLGLFFCKTNYDHYKTAVSFFSRQLFKRKVIIHSFYLRRILMKFSRQKYLLHKFIGNFGKWDLVFFFTRWGGLGLRNSGVWRVGVGWSYYYALSISSFMHWHSRAQGGVLQLKSFRKKNIL